MAATVSGVLRGFPKTRGVSGWLPQSTWAPPSAQAAPDARKQPPNPISIRLRSIAPPQPGTHRAPSNIYRAEEGRCYASGSLLGWGAVSSRLERLGLTA